VKGSLFDREKQIFPGKRRRFIGSAEEVASDIRDYRTVGVDTMIFDVRRPTIAENVGADGMDGEGRVSKSVGAVFLNVAEYFMISDLCIRPCQEAADNVILRQREGSRLLRLCFGRDSSLFCLG